MEHSHFDPTRLADADLHIWFEAASRVNRAVAYNDLVNALARPVRAADLVRTCRDFRRAWGSYRHLLRPLAEYASTAVVSPAGGRTTAAGAPAPVSSSSGLGANPAEGYTPRPLVLSVRPILTWRPR